MNSNRFTEICSFLSNLNINQPYVIYDPPSWVSLPSPSPSHPSKLIQSPCLSFLRHTAVYPKCSTWVQSRKWQHDLCLFPRHAIQYHGNPSLYTDQNCWRSRSGTTLWRPSRINTPPNYVFFIIGDWNVKVRSQEISGVTGKFGLVVQNEVGQRLTELCQEKALVIANTLFQQHKIRLYIWTSPDGHTKIRLIIFFAAKDREALYSQQKQDRELIVAQIMNSSLQN